MVEVGNLDRVIQLMSKTGEQTNKQTDKREKQQADDVGEYGLVK